MHELTVLDLTIIVLYMIGMLLVGVWFVKRIKNTGDFYVAGRTLGPFVLTATVCASIIGGSAMMGRAGIAYTTGFKAIMTAIPYLHRRYVHKCSSRQYYKKTKSYKSRHSIPFSFFSGKHCLFLIILFHTSSHSVACLF